MSDSVRKDLLLALLDPAVEDESGAMKPDEGEQGRHDDREERRQGTISDKTTAG